MVAISVVASGTAAFLLGATVTGRWKAKDGGGTKSNTSTLLYLWGILLETPPDAPRTPVSVKVRRRNASTSVGSEAVKTEAPYLMAGCLSLPSASVTGSRALSIDDLSCLGRRLLENH